MNLRSIEMRTARRLAVAGAALVALPLTTGCQTRIGEAATVGDKQISTSSLTSFLDRSTAALAASGPSPSAAQVKSLQQGVLNLLVQVALLDQVCKQHGITVSNAQVSAEQASEAKQVGGEKALETQAAQNGLSATDLPLFLRKQVLLTALQTQLKLTTNAAVINALSQKNSHIGVRINPRFGTWNTKALTIAGASDDLSSTATSK